MDEAGFTGAVGGDTSSSIWGDLWGLAKQRAAGAIAARNAADVFDAQARYGVDQNGQPFLRGQATSVSPIGNMGQVLVIGGALLAVTIVVVLVLKD